MPRTTITAKKAVGGYAPRKQIGQTNAAANTAARLDLPVVNQPVAAQSPQDGSDTVSNLYTLHVIVLTIFLVLLCMLQWRQIGRLRV